MIGTVVRCKNCLITTKCPDTTIDKGQICNHCLDVQNGKMPQNRHFCSKEEKKQLAGELNYVLKTTKGKGDYDCIVGYSGGKDSTYLLYKLKRDYPNLRILAATVTVGLIMNEIAEENIRETLRKLEVDHICFTPSESFYKKFFRHLLLNRKPGGYKAGLFETKELTEETTGLCAYCHEIVNDIMLKHAVERRIPLHITGMSPAQPLFSFFREDPQKLRTVDKTPRFMFEPPFTKEDRTYCWNPAEYPDDCEIPQMFYPFHVWEYNSEKMRREIYDAGLISSYKKTSPLRSNCKMNILMAYIDYQIDGYFNILPYFSFLIRHGLAEKKEWSKPIKILEGFLLKLGNLGKVGKNSSVRKLEKQLDVESRELVKKFILQKQIK